MRRYIFYIIFFLLGLAFTALVYAQGSPSQKWVNAIESYFNGTNYVNVSSSNPLPSAIMTNGGYANPSNPLAVQDTSSYVYPVNQNQFYYQGLIPSSIYGINACIVPTSGHAFYVTHVILQDIESAGSTSNWKAGIAVGVSGGTSTSYSMSAINTTLSTLTPPVVNIYSAAPTDTSFYDFLFLFNSSPATITSEAQRSIGLTGTAELPIVAAVSSQGQEICFYEDTSTQWASFMVEGYEL